MTISYDILVTSSRMPFALDAVRKLGRTGHRVHAADTFAAAPGSHSKYIEASYTTASPRYESRAFVDDVLAIIEEAEIDLLIPAFEESFYLTTARDEIDAHTRMFAPSFDTLHQLHDKVRFAQLAESLGLPSAAARVATSRDELRALLPKYDQYFARPAFSRGGVDVLTNTGPLAGALSLDDVEPTERRPWMVQNFLKGPEVCTLSIVHDGWVAAHCTYVHPRSIDHAGGIVFVSRDEPRTLEYTRRVVKELDYTGFIAFDFIEREEDGELFAVECNPRLTNGAVMMSDEMFIEGLFHGADKGPDAETAVVPAGERSKIGIALIRDMVMNWREIPEDLDYLLSDAKDIYAEPGDVLPALYSVLSYAHVFAYRMKGEHTRSDLMAAYFDDICWNGDPIEL